MTIRHLTIKERILLHLFEYSRFAEEYEAPLEVAQAGIGEAVGIRVENVGHYIRALVAEDLVDETKSYIKGKRRRLKAYFLTVKGRHRVASQRTSLMREEVPFRTLEGSIEEIRLSKVCQEERRGSSLLQLLQELETEGHIAQEFEEPQTVGPVDFSQEAPVLEHTYGREREVEAVLGALDSHPAVIVTGVAGVGKTALASRVGEAVRGNRSLFWRRIRPWDTTSELTQRLSGFLRMLGKNALSGYLMSSETRELSKIEESLAEDLTGVHGLLVFDDVQNASEEARAFFSTLLEALKDKVGPSALLLSRTSPEFSTGSGAPFGGLGEVPLEGLDRESGRALLANFGIRDAQAEPILDAANGNPLLLKILALRGEGETPRAARESLEAYFAEELEPGLSEKERRCLEAASLFEVPVRPEGLLLEGRAEQRILVGLQKKGLLHQSVGSGLSLPDSLRSYFRQSLLAERKEILVEKIAPWLLEEAEKAAESGEPERAKKLVENALFIETKAARRVTSFRRLGELRRVVGDYLGSNEAFRDALGDAKEEAVAAELHAQIASNYHVIWHLDEAEEEVRKGLRLLLPGPSVERAHLLLRNAEVALYRKNFEMALHNVEEVMGWIPDRIGDGELEAEARGLRGLVSISHPNPPDVTRALDDCRASLRILESMGKRRDLPFAHFGMGVAYQYVAKTDRALRHFDWSASLAEKMGDSPGRLRALFAKAGLLARLGRLERAQELYGETFDMAGELHPWYRLIWHHLRFARLHWLQGRLEEAKASLERFWKDAQELPVSDDKLGYLNWLVRLSVLNGDQASARTYLETARDLVRQIGPEEGDFRVEWAEGAVDAAAGETLKADARFLRALELAKSEVRGHVSRGELFLEYGRFLASSGDGRKSSAILLRAYDELRTEGAKPLELAAREELRSARSARA